MRLSKLLPVQFLGNIIFYINFQIKMFSKIKISPSYHNETMDIQKCFEGSGLKNVFFVQLEKFK